jgi:hypothetical protein
MIQGITYNKSTTQSTADSIQIANTTGMHIICYTTAGTLTDITTFNAENVYYTNAITCAIYWNATQGLNLITGNEQHSIWMGWENHYYDHRFFHTQYDNGLGLSGFTLGIGNSAANAQFSVLNGEITDEDLDFTITGGSPQTLSPIANIPILYLTGSTPVWAIKAADVYPLI